jgi:UDP-N-acetylmuramoylalanine--D-glutamate ligase
MNIKKIAIWGFGVTGQASLNYFLRTNTVDQPAQIDVFDGGNKQNFNSGLFEQLPSNVNFHFGVDEIQNIQDYDLLMISPSISEQKETIIKARKSGIEIHSDVSYFISQWQKTGKKSVGVTGSNGKSTVVSLIHGSLLSAGVKSILVGNIGKSPLDYLLAYENGDLLIDVPVIELSSYQLESFSKNEYADIAVITNISPNHLDHHNNSMEEYVGAKLNIAGLDSKLVTVVDNEGVQKYVLPKIKECVPVTLDEISPELEPFVDESSRNLKGLHNLYNIAVALEVLKLLDINLDLVTEFLKNYSGLEHRIEFVREIDGVRYINDSKATSPDATRIALEAFGDRKNIILFMGGTDKKVSFSALNDHLNEYVKYLIIMDHDINDQLIELADDNNTPYFVADDLESGIKKAREIAEQGNIVLLSPAAASLGKFKNFEDRGEKFKKIVNNL